MAFGGHRVYPNSFDIIRPYLGTCITPSIFYGGEIGISEHIVVFNLRYRSFRSLVRKRRCKLGRSNVLAPRFVVTLVVRFAVVNPISHFLSNASGETLFRLVDEIELIFTCSSNDDVKASILKLVLGVGVVVFVQSFMHYGCTVGVFVFGLGGRGDLILRTSRLGFSLVLISPFQFFIALYCLE